MAALLEERVRRRGGRRCRRPRARASRARARGPRGTERATRRSRVGVPTVNVRVMSEKRPLSWWRGKRSQTIDVVVPRPARALVVAVGGLWAVRRDRGRRRGSRARRTPRSRRRGERSHVSGSPSSIAAVRRRARSGEQLGDRRQPRLGRPRRGADALELIGRLAPPAVVEEPLVDRQLDAVGAERVGVLERERARHDGVSRTPSAGRYARLMIGASRSSRRRRAPGRRTGTSRRGRSRPSGRPR